VVGLQLWLVGQRLVGLRLVGLRLRLVGWPIVLELGLLQRQVRAAHVHAGAH